MGSLLNNLGAGLGFMIVGLWQLFNHIKLHSQRPKEYNPSTWFPTSKSRYIELHLIMVASFFCIIMELFINPSHHDILDPEDWTIPTHNLPNFYHATIALAILTYAAFTILFDKKGVKSASLLSTILCSLCFSIELLFFHLHTYDHPSIEFHSHLLLQLAILVSLITSLMGIGFPKVFALGFLRSFSIFFQGVWFLVMGILIYIPKFIPKGCSIELDEGEDSVPCTGHLSLHRAKGLSNLEFAWALLAAIAFSMWFYLYVSEKYPEENDFGSLSKGRDEEEELCESPKMMGNWLKPKDLER